MRRFARLLVLLSAPAAMATAAPPPSLPEVRVTESAGVARRAAPGLVSVPVPRGGLDSVPALTLRASGAAPWPGAGRVLERWADGSIRWLAVSFAASCPAGCRSLRRLTADAPVAAAPGLTVDRPAATTALARLGDDRGTGLVDLPWPALIVDDTSLPPPVVEGTASVMRDGVVTETTLRARHANGLHHEVRLAVFAGQPAVRIRYTLTHLGAASYLRLASLPLLFPWRSVRGEIAVDGAARTVALIGRPASYDVLQRDAGQPLVDGRRNGRHADGIARVRGGGSAWTVAVPAFWQEYPKRISLTSDGITIDLAAAGDDPLLLGVGAAKTWELWVAVHPDGEAPPLVPAGQALLQPLLGWIDPGAVVASGALPEAITPLTPGAEGFLPALRREIARYRARAGAERWDDGPPGACTTRTALRLHTGFYGAFNWGDWNFPGLRDETKGCDAWGNLEYDLPWVLGLAWLASGDADLWTLFQDSARHYRDVDVIHHWPGHPERVGMNHPHKVRHFATDAPNTVDLGHVWLQGLLLHYRLTGEARSREAVVRMADTLVPKLDRAKNPRQFGWPMVALAAAFDATGDVRYRNAGLAYAAAGAARFPPDPNAEWKMGILAEGMMAVHRSTGDASVWRWLDEYGRRLLLPAPEPRDPRLVVPAGYLWEVTGEPRFAALARDTAAALRPGNWGKSLASVGRVGFALLGPLARRPPPLTPARAAPPPASPPAPRSPSPRPSAPSPPSGR